MQGIAVLEALLILVIAVALLAVAVPWIYDSLQKSKDISETQAIRGQLEQCNDKLVETARTGTSNRCIFSSEKGAMTAFSDGIYYKITTQAEICSQQDWTEINKDKHIWQKCNVQDGTKQFQLKWSWPNDITIQGQNLDGEILRSNSYVADIKFNDSLDFRTLTLVVQFNFTEGQSGKIIEINRIGFDKEKAILKVEIK